MDTNIIEQLHDEANRMNQLYDFANQKQKQNSFYDCCVTYGMQYLLKQWDFEKNLLILGVTPHTISKSSDIRPYWYCEKHDVSYRCSLSAKVRNIDSTQCTLCVSEKRRLTKAAKLGSFLEWCKQNGEYGQFLFSEWDAGNNKQELDIEMNNINYNSSKEVYWKCITCGYEWRKALSVRTLHKDGKCPRCMILNNRDKRQETVLKNRNLLLWCQNNGEAGERLINEWDTEKNDITMEQITPNYMQKVHWKCDKGHEFQVTPYYRTYYKKGCPVCSHRSRRGKTLNETCTDLLKEWDYSKNEKQPEEYSKWSQERVWWKCPECGHEWQAMISGRAKQGTGCPKCHHNWTR